MIMAEQEGFVGAEMDGHKTEDLVRLENTLNEEGEESTD